MKNTKLAIFSSVFEQARQYSLEAFIREKTCSELVRVGSVLRVQPCPLCGHFDCFTIYPASNTFHCFSCERSGDIINFVRYLHGLATNFEAARALVGGGMRSTPIVQPTKKEGRRGVAQEKITLAQRDPEKARRVRLWVARWYHGSLMGDRRALDYLVHSRGHRIATLRACLVGLSMGRGLVRAAREAGWDASDLLGLGLVNRNPWGGLEETIPAGCIVFPHFYRENVLYFSFKDPGKRYRFQVKKCFADPDWLCLGQDALHDREEVWITEGEHDYLSLLDIGIKEGCATIGNFNTSNILKYLSEHSAGRKFYLAFDSDDAGNRYTTKYSRVILEAGGRVYRVDPIQFYREVEGLG